MKKLFLILAATLSFFKAQADYDPTLLPTLIDGSDLIIYGEIIGVQKEGIIVNAIEIVKGIAPKGGMIIERFENWTCASRFAPYKTGQKEFFFLKKRRGIAKYFALGAANEGEMPVVSHKVYYKYQYLSIDKNPQLFAVYGGAVRGYVYDKTEFINALKFYLRHSSDIQTNIVHNQARIDTTRNTALLRIFEELKAPHF
ncbi:hypothetical protein ACFST9_02485 [Hymenobacter monticola]|uniref:DUF4468 domain-containing protein n=1 Tax=Hymenobacter monticola TaxID=1705399 RepID=A0ABY4B1Z4_9BACT|nr:hypothetical protein [Hymenobacter monticola]UOE33172.1 hypothetical protein MTP16_18850 [Hymenobacter monticola]